MIRTFTKRKNTDESTAIIDVEANIKWQALYRQTKWTLKSLTSIFCYATINKQNFLDRPYIYTQQWANVSSFSSLNFPKEFI